MKPLNKYKSVEPVTYFQTATPIYLPTDYMYPKQEFRGVWVCTIKNIDVPIQSSIEQYKETFLNMLDTIESYHLNTIVFQVRPKNDAFYESKLNPWSRYLTGQEGVHPGWDPLPWMIEESHKRGLDFHAWFNPYRVTTTDVSPNNSVVKHPDYVIQLNQDSEIFNPGLPEVQQFVIESIVEVAEKYDIDGVHFDDYFYPYGGLNPSIDENEFCLFNPNQLSLDDWRRENVNRVIKGIKSELTRINHEQQKSITLGMSPFGIWANKTSLPLGSNTRGGCESYSELYADSYKWVKEEWVDYIVPQLYFEFVQENAPYADLVDWWANLVKGTRVNLFIGHALYRFKEKGWKSGPWENPDELNNQLLYNSKYPEITGSIHFRYLHLIEKGPENLLYAQKSLKETFYKYNVLPPVYNNIATNTSITIEGLKLEKTNQGNQLTWKKVPLAKAYYVYRFEKIEPIDITDISKVIQIIRPNDSSLVTYLDFTSSKDVTYVITAFDQANHEGPFSEISFK